MTNTTGTVEFGQPTASTGKVLNERQIKVQYKEALDALEKNHRLQKLQAEIAIFRAKEVEANLYYMDLMRKFNSDQNSAQSQPETAKEDPKERDSKVYKLEVDEQQSEPSY